MSDEELEAAMGKRRSSGSPAVTVVGDPVRARESVARFAEAGVDELLLVMQLGTVPHELVMESIRTFGEKVLPHFA
jgi:alkanesulfonate monooxygenase SsuD/methylene tetrahydromethanopterin reductase-like flavin-dependent oxidoreductase (luciferase family)